MNKNSTYWKLRQYAYKINRRDYRDLVHDSYVLWFNKTGESLFDAPLFLAFTVIKRENMRKYRAKLFMYQGELYSKVNTPIIEDADNFWEGKQSPLDSVVGDDLLDKFNKSLTKKERDFAELLYKGYNVSEIAEMNGSYRQLAHHTIRKLRKKLKKVL